MLTAQNSHWKETPIGEILTFLDDQIEFDDMAEYITITVKRRHGGLEAREKLFGHQIKTKKQYRLHKDAFIISRVQCWHAAFAIVPDDIPNNMIASQNYDQFEVSSKVDSQFFWWLSHSPQFIETVRDSASGVVIEKMVFNRDAWLQKTLPLPPLNEQRRIVARIEALAGRIAEARSLRQAAAEEGNTLLRSAMRQIFKPDGAQIVELETTCTAIIDNLHSNPVYADNATVPCIRSSDVGWGELFLDTARKTDEDEYARRTVRGEPSENDIVLVREGGGTGKAALVEKHHRFSLGQRVMMLRPDQSKVLPKFFLYQILSPFIYEEQIMEKSKGSASPHLNIGALRKFRFILPPPDGQRRIVAYLEGLSERVHALRRLQAESQAELDALLPSVLDRAFKGEL